MAHLASRSIFDSDSALAQAASNLDGLTFHSFPNAFEHEGLWIEQTNTLCYVNIAIENGPFIVALPMKNGDFP